MQPCCPRMQITHIISCDVAASRRARRLRLRPKRRGCERRSEPNLSTARGPHYRIDRQPCVGQRRRGFQSQLVLDRCDILHRLRRMVGRQSHIRQSVDRRANGNEQLFADVHRSRWEHQLERHRNRTRKYAAPTGADIDSQCQPHECIERRRVDAHMEQHQCHKLQRLRRMVWDQGHIRQSVDRRANRDR